jgi:hypothetical protein
MLQILGPWNVGASGHDHTVVHGDPETLGHEEAPLMCRP